MQQVLMVLAQKVTVWSRRSVTEAAETGLLLVFGPDCALE